MRVWTADYKAALLKDAFRSTVIRSVDNYSSGDKINIEVKLVGPEALGEIYHRWEKEHDPYSEFLNLHKSLEPFLNMINLDGAVSSYATDDYHSIMFDWIPVRREYYIHRFERRKELLCIGIKIEEEILRFIPLAAEFDFAKKKNIEDAARVLKEHEFCCFDIGAFRKPGNGRAIDVHNKVYNPKVANPYSYILELKQSDLNETAFTRRVARLAEKKAELATVESHLAESPFAGASTWSNEIDQLMSVVEKGRRLGWKK
jgi:hypothetical protein